MNNINPSVTVIVPAYNSAQYIEDTLQSVLEQTYQSFEVFVIDDGSTDRTQEIIASFCQKDCRIHLIAQPNRGVSQARNAGIQRAKGKYIAFLDADDLWHPEKLEVHVRHLDKSKSLGLSYAQIEFIQEDGTTTGKVANTRLKDLEPFHFYLENPACTPSNIVVRRPILEKVNGFHPNLQGMGDSEISFKIACAGWKIEGIEKVLVKYRISPSSLSSQLEKMEEQWDDFNQVVSSYAPELVSQYYRQGTAMYFRYIARRALRSNPNPRLGVSFINRALVIDWKLLFRQPKRTLLTLLAAHYRLFFRIESSFF